MTRSIISSPRTSLLLGGLAISALAGLAPTPVIVRDRFTNNVINPTLWDEHSFGVVTVAETNQRLQFAAAVNSGADGYAGLEVAPWGANWKYDFEIEVDYKINLGNVSGEREVIVGIGLALVGQFPENFTGFAAAVGRDDVGLFLAIARYSNGNIVAFNDANLGASQGELNLEWDRSDDRLTARVGATQVVLNGPWAQFGGSMGSTPMVIGIGCMTVDGNRTFPGSRVWIDEFKFEGVKRAR